MAMSPEELEQTVLELKDKIDNIMNTVSESEKAFQHKKGVEDFTARNSEALGKYADKLKKLNGEDFDIFGSAYDEYNNDFSDIEEATYVTQLVSEIDNKLAQLKEALNDDEVEVKSDEETTEVKTDDETIETPAEEPKAEDEAESEEKAEDATDESTEEKDVEEPKAEDEAEEELDEDAILDESEEDFVKDLEDEYDKYHR